MISPSAQTACWQLPVDLPVHLQLFGCVLPVHRIRAVGDHSTWLLETEAFLRIVSVCFDLNFNIHGRLHGTQLASNLSGFHVFTMETKLSRSRLCPVLPRIGGFCIRTWLTRSLGPTGEHDQRIAWDSVAYLPLAMTFGNDYFQDYFFESLKFICFRDETWEMMIGSSPH